MRLTSLLVLIAAALTVAAQKPTDTTTPTQDTSTEPESTETTPPKDGNSTETPTETPTASPTDDANSTASETPAPEGAALALGVQPVVLTFLVAGAAAALL